MPLPFALPTAVAGIALTALYVENGWIGRITVALGLGPIALTLCGASDPEIQKRIDAIVADCAPGQFAARFLAGAGLEWAAPLLAGFSSSPTPEEGESR